MTPKTSIRRENPIFHENLYSRSKLGTTKLPFKKKHHFIDNSNGFFFKSSGCDSDEDIWIESRGKQKSNRGESTLFCFCFFFLVTIPEWFRNADVKKCDRLCRPPPDRWRTQLDAVGASRRRRRRRGEEEEEKKEGEGGGGGKTLPDAAAGWESSGHVSHRRLTISPSHTHIKEKKTHTNQIDPHTPRWVFIWWSFWVSLKKRKEINVFKKEFHFSSSRRDVSSRFRGFTSFGWLLRTRNSWWPIRAAQCVIRVIEREFMEGQLKSNIRNGYIEATLSNEPMVFPTVKIISRTAKKCASRPNICGPNWYSWVGV